MGEEYREREKKIPKKNRILPLEKCPSRFFHKRARQNHSVFWTTNHPIFKEKYLNFRAKNQITMIFELVDKKLFLKQCVMTSKCRTKKTAKMMKMNFESSTCIFLCFTNINACIFFVTIVIINACAALSINRKTTAFLPYLRRNYEG